MPNNNLTLSYPSNDEMLERIRGVNHFSEGLSFLNVPPDAMESLRQSIAEDAARFGAKPGTAEMLPLVVHPGPGTVDTAYFVIYFPGTLGGRTWLLEQLPRNPLPTLRQYGLNSVDDFTECDIRRECFCNEDNDQGLDDYNYSDDCAVCDYGAGWCVTHASDHR